MSHSSKNPRQFKGESIIDFPDNYVVVDIETTGFSPYCDSIIEVSAVRCIDKVAVESFSSLIKPDEAKYDEGYISSVIHSLTGITHEMLVDAPSASVVLPEFKNFIGGAIIVGHNISFDINFLYDYFEKYLNCYLSNDHINTERIFKRLHPEVMRSRLADMSKLYQVNTGRAHRAINDCITTEICFEKMKLEILKNYTSYRNFKDQFYGLRTSDINLLARADMNEIDITNPFYGKICAFTGTLEEMTRTVAMQMVINRGGECGNSVTRKTNYLVLGDNEYCANIKDGKSAKQKRAEQLKSEGYDIEIIPESVFLDMLDK